MTDLKTAALGSAVEAIAEEIDRDVRGAWMAGYDWYHVFAPVAPSVGDAEQHTLRHYGLPSNHEYPPQPEGLVYQHSYDLGLSAAEAEVRQREREGEDGHK